MPLSEYVYVVCGHPIPMTEQEDQRVCIKVCIKPEHSSVDTIPISQKDGAMGNWGLAALSQHIHSCSSLCRVLWRNIKSAR